MRYLKYALSKYTPKPLRSPVYKHLYKKYGQSYFFDKNQFLGKKVLIIGPASTVHQELGEIDTSKYDVVVKMNNGIFTHFDELKNKDQCNILFHSLTSETRGISNETLLKNGVTTLVHRTPKRSSFLSTIIADEKFSEAATVKIIPFEEYEELSQKLAGFSPSTGLSCINFFISAPTEELAIIGFTFFTTNYVEGYDVNVTSDSEAIRKVKDAGHHSPEREADFVNSIINKAVLDGKVIVVGSKMNEAMSLIISK